METVKIKIDHTNHNYKTLLVTVDENLSSKDANTFFIMFENFIDNCKQQKIKFVWIVDLKNISLTTLNFSYFETLRRICKKNYETFLDLLICSVVITNSTIFNHFFTLFRSLYTPVKPILNTESIENAISFVDDCFNNKHKNDSIIY